MPRRPCLDCGRPSSSTRCPSCQRSKDRTRNTQRTHYQHGWEQRSRQARQAWVAEHGWLCPGYGRPAHKVKPGSLQYDHSTGMVLCPRCNVAAGPAGPDAVIPHIK